MKNAKYLLSTLALLAACGGEAETASTSAPAAGPTPDHTAHMEIFVMSKCPYGVQVENALVPVKKKLGAAFDLDVYFIGAGTEGSLTSMHGETEVKGDLAQVCAGVQMPDGNLDFIACQNGNSKKVDTNWEDCGKELGLDVPALTQCIDGPEGQKLLAASFAEAASRGAKGSPTIYLDGEQYGGGRKEADFMRAICGTYGDQAPQACADIPKPVEVAAIFLSDERCKECDIKPVEAKLKGTLPGLKPRYVDYSSAEGKELYQSLKAASPEFGLLPTVLLDPSVEKDEEGHKALARFLRPAGGYVELKLGGKFDPTAEICDNSIDDDGNGSVDCADTGCEGNLACREEVAKQLDLFIMSHCPYGAKAVLAVNDVMANFKGDMNVDIHFIGGEKDGKLSSMHGQAEVDDDLREICAAKHAPDKFMAFDVCISRDYKKADWKACAKEAGIGAGVIESCVTGGEGEKLLAASFKEAAALGIGSSPTYMVNNRRFIRPRGGADIQAEFCRDNPGLAGCSTTIATSDEAAKPVPAGECGG